MAALDFPSAPTLGQIYTENNRTYVWTGVSWASRTGNGYTGSLGYTGSQGPIGYTGSRGDTGYTGSQGIQGVIGYTGSQGTQGVIGYTGSQGPIGYTGSRGDTGYTGSQGIQGVIGYTGSRGDTGYTGSQGIQGPIGYTGSQGPIGYTGSQGPIGYTGSQGPIGYTGSQGPIGYTGSRGDTGYTGSRGDTGYTGSSAVGQTAGSTTTGFINYSGTTKTNGQMYGGTSDPTNVTRLNYDGYLYVTRIYGDGSQLTGLTAGATITDDTTTNATRYLLWDDVTSGNATTVGVSSTKLYFNPSTGTLNATVFNSLSDGRLKDNVTPIDNSVEIINQLNGVGFTWKETGHKSYGIIAQELELILPELVEGNDTKTVNYSGIIAFLINAIKELDQRIINLENTKDKNL
jgi:hypothetical protein